MGSLIQRISKEYTWQMSKIIYIDSIIDDLIATGESLVELASQSERRTRNIKDKAGQIIAEEQYE